MMESPESLSCLICVFSYLINYSESLSYYIPEQQLKDTIIGNIVIDENIRDLVSEDTFNNLEFHFLNLDNKYLNHFSIDSSSGVLSVKEPIDREVICEFSKAFSCLIEIEVVAQDKIGTFFKKIAIDINIKDINDHPPEFDTPAISLTLLESEIAGKSIIIDGASDKDSSNYSVQSYEVLPADALFRTDFKQIDEETSVLKLVVDGELDRETVDNYLLKIVAKDGGDPQLTGAVVVNITIEDANDEKPIFDKLVYNVTVKENIALNTTILTVRAVDLDIGENAEIKYQLSVQQPQDIKDTFKIDSETGDIMVIGQLKYTSESAVKVKIEAIDKGTRPQTSHATVEVTVEDSENYPPEIKLNLLSQTGSAETSEYASVGAVVAHVEIADSDGGRNGMVACTIDNNFFNLQGLEPNEYKVIVFNRLDREAIERHNVTIFCHDFGVPRQNSSKQFTVVVTDENDNPPLFPSSQYHSFVQENNNASYAVIQIYAKDADIGLNGRVSYYLMPENQTAFGVNAKTGLVTAKVSFDRENISNYQFTVIAVDAGNPPLSSSVSVYVDIDDQNDNAPKFVEDPFILHIPENQLKETVFGDVLATDIDDPVNGNGGVKGVTYKLFGNYTDLPFLVLPDGKIKTTEQLDREQKDRYEFTVMAIDNGINVRLNSTVNVTVEVKDINDNSPIIEYPNDPNFVKYVTYMAPAKTQIMKIEAKDEDAGKNAELSYRISSRNDTKMFEIGRNGEIYIARRMYESDINLYKLVITISDRGDNPRTALTQVQIVVLTKNLTGTVVDEDITDQQNIIIAVIVVVITVIIAVAILLIMWIVRRKDQQKRKYLENHSNHANINHTGDNDSGFSSNGGRKTPDGMKMFNTRMVPTAPIPDMMNLAPDRTDGKIKDVKFQDEVHVREKNIDSSGETGIQNQVQLHRLASIRLHQALIQSQNKPWNSQTELNDNSKDGKRQEDMHSDMSADTATYDSGIGGSVSDTGDFRLAQLQHIVRQSGRRGQPPHKSQNGPGKPPRIIARSRAIDPIEIPPERPPPIKNNPYKTTKSPVQSPAHLSPSVSPTKFTTSSPTPYSANQSRFTTKSPTIISPQLNVTNLSPRQSPSRNVVQDLLRYKKFQSGLMPGHGRLTIDESVDTTHYDDDESTTSGSYYIDNTGDDLQQYAPVSDIYV